MFKYATKKIVSLLLVLITSFTVFGLFQNISFTPAQAEEIINKTEYISDDTMVVDIDLTKAPYNADNTGKEDCSAALKNAISYLDLKGGGTIYMPAGKYRLTQSITVNNYITIVGDYNDPDSGKDYGTVIIADVASTTQDLPALFRLRGSSGVVGLTIYYPNQAIDDVRPYPYTFEIMGGAISILEHMQFTIKNVTLLNSYKGIAASRTVNPDPNIPIGQQDAHEGLIIENLKGTVLKYGINAVNESDIGYYKNITFSPKYWAQAEGYNNPTEEEIRDYTIQDSCGIMLGDLEWSPYYDITVDGYKTGVHIIQGTRLQEDFPITFMGAFYNLTIDNCAYGLVADSLYWGWGMLVTNSKINASIIAVENNSDVGYIRLTNVQYTGSIAGERIYKNMAEAPVIDVTTPTLVSHKSKIYNVVMEYGVANDGYTECGDKIQKALDDAGENGGGVVYLPAGYYKVSTRLNVPEGVLLRGSSSVTNRDTLNKSNGTVIFSYCDEEATDPETDTAFITLNKNAGLSGLRICYPENNLRFIAKDVYDITPTAYTVRLIGDNAYVTNVGLVGVYNGIHVLNSKNCVVKGVPALFFNHGITVNGSENVHLENIFSNATVATQAGFHFAFPDLFKDGWLWRITHLWNYYTYTETHTKFFNVYDSQNVTIMSAFTFCSARILKAVGSQVTMIGCGADRMWHDGIVADLSNSDLTIINLLKYRCMTYNLADNSKIAIYGRMNLRIDSGVQAYNDVEYNISGGVFVPDTTITSTMNNMNVTYTEAEEYKSQSDSKDPFIDLLNLFKK